MSSTDGIQRRPYVNSRGQREAGIWIRATARGETFEITWRSADGRQRRRTVRGGVTEARAELKREHTKRQDGELPPADSRLTFDAAADAWWAARVVRLRPATQAAYGSHLKHLRRKFGARRLTEITPTVIAAHIAELGRSGVAGWTQRGRLTLLSGVFTYAGRHLGHTMPNPCSLLDRVERPNIEDEREHRVLTDDELAKLLSAASEHDRLLLTTAAQTGARKGEVLGLTWGDLDASARTLRIERQLDRRELTRAALKTRRSRRTVAISPNLVAALLELRIARGRPADDALMFTRPGGQPYTHSAFDYALAQAAKRAGIEPPPSPHSLRHSHVSRLFAAGRDPVSIAARIGDSVETVLSVYAHEYDAARRRHDESDELGELYDREVGSILAAQDHDNAQHSANGAQAEVVALQAKRDIAQ